MRILLITDAWKPQVNGVVRTLSTVVDTLERRGHTVKNGVAGPVSNPAMSLLSGNPVGGEPVRPGSTGVR